MHSDPQLLQTHTQKKLCRMTAMIWILQHQADNMDDIVSIKMFRFWNAAESRNYIFLEYRDNSVDYLFFPFTGVATSVYRRSKSNAKHAGGTVGEGRGFQRLVFVFCFFFTPLTSH